MQINEKLAAEKSNKTVKVILLLAALLIISVIVTVIAALMPTRIKIEAGDTPDFYKIFNTEDYELDSSFDPDSINHPGKYELTVSYNNRSRDIVLIVVDTTAPVVRLHERIYVSSTDIIPTADDFIESITEADSYTGEILMDMNYDFQMGKSYEIEMYFKDASGNRTEVMTSILSYINDTQAPTIEVPTMLYFEIGAPITYRSSIKLSDNCIGDIKLEVDDSKVDVNKEGIYKITIKATDVAGNVATAEASVHIIPSGASVSIDDLNKRIASICNSIIKSDMTKEEKCRAVYAYVQSNIKYVSESKGEGYIEVAYNALDEKAGDCYSFFSLSKAFLDYLCIENIEIQRTEGKGEGTHYWNYVNIGTDSDPKWYHFDTTELVYNYNVSGCLLTTAQVEAYDEWRSGVYFRHFDKTKYPTSETKIITEIPELEKYMN